MFANGNFTSCHMFSNGQNFSSLSDVLCWDFFLVVGCLLLGFFVLVVGFLTLINVPIFY